jgi:hypothetical protein
VTTLAFLEATCSQAHSDDAFELDATENFGVPNGETMSQRPTLP